VGTPPFKGVAVNVTGVPAQTGPAGFAAMLTLAATGGLTSITIWLDKTGLPVTQAREEVIDTVIISLSFRAEDEYVELLPLTPTFIPFTLHWYNGVRPPFAGVAVNVTEVPAHMLPAGKTAIVTPAAATEVTDITI
jgi:hypothetical protein